jgi:hypothetical protein
VDTEEKQQIVESSIELIDSILEDLQSVRECKRIYDMLERAKVKLDEISQTFDDAFSEDTD